MVFEAVDGRLRWRPASRSYPTAWRRDIRCPGSDSDVHRTAGAAGHQRVGRSVTAGFRRRDHVGGWSVSQRLPAETFDPGTS